MFRFGQNLKISLVSALALVAMFSCAPKVKVKNFPDPSEEQIREQLDGNLCRCTGYHNIVKAIKAAAATSAGAPSPARTMR